MQSPTGDAQLGNVRAAWGVIVPLFPGLHAHDGEPQCGGRPRMGNDWPLVGRYLAISSPHHGAC